MLVPSLFAIAVPAALAGLVAIGVTVAIERWGGVVGGLVGTLPATIVPAALGMYSTSDPAMFQAAMFAVPIGMLVDAGFLYVWRVLPPRLPSGAPLVAQLALMILVSMSVWLVLALTALTFAERARAGLAVGLAAQAALVAVGALATARKVPAPGGTRSVGWVALVSRGVLAAVAVGVAILLSALGSPVIAGIASVFPAIFLTTMVSLWWSQGGAVSAGAVGPIMLGSTTVSAFALYAAFAMPAFGPVLGTVLAWLAAVLTFTLPASAWIRRPERRLAANPR